MRQIEELGKLSDIKCVIIDLDGTLMHTDKQISTETIDELLRLQQQGIHLVIATGRPKVTLPVLPKPLHIDYYISSNGSMIYDHDLHVVYQKCLEPRVVRQLADCFTDDHLVQYFIEGFMHVDRTRLEHVDDYEVPFSNRASLLAKGIAHENFMSDYEKNEYPCEKINILFRKPYEKLRMLKLRDRISQIPGIATVSGGVENLEVTDIHVNKAEAVAFVLERLGIDIGQTVGFGDSENDMELFSAVRYGIAMENACDALKAQAAAITKSNDEDGVAYALRLMIE